MKSARSLYFAFFFLLCIPNLGNSTNTATAAYSFSRQMLGENSTGVDPCWNFTVGDPQHMEFFSPGYPLRYPTSLECVRVISAPEGQVIHLNFRENLHIQKNIHCTNDFLEVRDGLHRSSNLIGRFCSSRSSKTIVSSGPHLWLRFVTDASIEDSRFRATYTFKPAGYYGVTIRPGYLFKRQAYTNGDHSDDPCSKFTMENEQQEFFSPMYPDAYPRSIECFRTIVAPERELIILDFRDQFNIEGEDGCKYDYLEVRDGQYGYSNMIGQYCGNSFPETIVSTGRFLWLRFVSDVSIEYKGFRAVYSFKPAEAHSHDIPECRIEKEAVEGWVNRSDISNETVALHQTYNIPLDCMFVISVKKDWNLQLQFALYKMDKPNECDSNYIEVFSNSTQMSHRVEKFCGSIAKTTTVKSNMTHIRFVAEPKAFNSTFAILWTAFREIKKDSPECTDDEFDCNDNNCIPLELKCNGNNNCRYAGDEDTETTCVATEGIIEKLFTETHMIAIVALFFIILAGMCSTFLYNCSRKLVRDHRTIKKQMAESRASKLDQLGRAISMPQLSTVLPIGSNSHSHSDDSSGISVLQRVECCVPEAELMPILRSSTHTEDLLLMPEMRDSECQTRESLFHTASFTPISSAAESYTPPPPPPPTSRPPRSTPRSTASPGFTTFGKPRQKASVEPRYRAEAVIELNKRADSNKTSERPFSVQSTKSAPDVIVTH